MATNLIYLLIVSKINFMVYYKQATMLKELEERDRETEKKNIIKISINI